MSINISRFAIFYSLVFLLNILFFYVLTDYRIVAKPLIVTSLLGFYSLKANPQSNAFVLGLICALFGDIFLLFEGMDFFMIGLGSFLFMQILYTYRFYQDRAKITKLKIVICGLLLVFGVSILTLLWEFLGDLQIAITLYSIAIISMAINAIVRNSKLQGYQTVVIGVFLFIVSDSLLAINKFGHSFIFGEQLVMITYMLAQYYIVTGIVSTNKQIHV